MSNKCKTCIHWRSKQRELDYRGYIGFCTNGDFAYNTVEGCLIGVYDSETKKANEIETQNKHIPYGSPKKSKYLVVTSESFGCIFHEIEKKNKP